MPRTESPSQPSDAEDYKPERGDERIFSARKLRQDAGDEDDKHNKDDDEDDEDDDEPDDYYDYEAARAVEPARRRDDDDEDDDEEALTEADVMEVLDLDDLKKMEGPDT